jgi:hypothetical protein
MINYKSARNSLIISNNKLEETQQSLVIYFDSIKIISFYLNFICLRINLAIIS